MENLKIRQKIEDMIIYGYQALRQFPRSEKFTLAAEIKRSMIRLLSLVIACNKRYYKKNTLQELDIELDVLLGHGLLRVGSASSRWQLEQRVECRRVLLEPELSPDEREQQHRLPRCSGLEKYGQKAVSYGILSRAEIKGTPVPVASLCGRQNI